MTSRLTAFEKVVLEGLTARAGIAAKLLDVWVNLPPAAPQTAQSITALAQLGVTEERGAQEVLGLAEHLGLLVKVATGYVPANHPPAVFQRLALALFSVEYYKATVHRDATVAQVVLTKPPRPCVLEDRLAGLGWRTHDLEPTEQAFLRLVQQATSRVVVMTPFFDAKGAVWLQALFANIPATVTKVLVLRSLEDPGKQDYPKGFDGIAAWLVEKKVNVYNYSIPRTPSPGRETFHAKVVLSDDNVAYVGSSNLNAASLEHSMEIGVALQGKAARAVGIIIEAVLSASTLLF